MTRAEKVVMAQELRAKGLLVREIGERMGVSRTAAQTWLSDPLLSQQQRRRSRYAGKCADCGRRTDGSNGPAAAPRRCERCAAIHQHETRLWTPERVVEELRMWAKELGRTPVSQEALRGGARVGCSVVQREFGSWTAGLKAAGLTPNKRGGKRVTA